MKFFLAKDIENIKKSGVSNGFLVSFFFKLVTIFFLEFFSIGLVVPFVAILVSPEKLKYLISCNNFCSLIFDFLLRNVYFLCLIGVSLFVLINFVRIIIAKDVIKKTYLIGNHLSEYIFSILVSDGIQVKNYSKSEAVADLTTTVNQYTQGCLLAFVTILNGSLFFIGLILFAVFYEIKTIYVMLFFILGSYLYIKNVKKKLSTNGFAVLEKNNEAIKIINDAVENYRYINIYHLSEKYLGRFIKNYRDMRSTQAENLFLSSSYKYFLEIFIFLLLLGVITLYGVNLTETLFLELVVFLIIAQRILPVISAVVNSYALLTSSLGSRYKLFKYFELDNNGLNIVYPDTKFYKCLTIRNASFSYVKTRFKLEVDFFEVKMGQKIAIIGESGSGKSTFLDILLGFNIFDFGEILIDGISCKNNFSKILKKEMGYIGQNQFIFEGTIIQNIVMDSAANVDYQRIYLLAKEFNLYDQINALPEKFNTIIGGTSPILSGGQIQRLSLIRSLYCEPRILILDEPTSALDPDNADRVMRYLSRVNITLLLISHSSEFLAICSDFYKISNGKVIKL
jgi:ABC-type bacteriocin/lantibiotic exporter with double-glycine peptidase domain